jgi:hypothetical protein
MLVRVSLESRSSYGGVSVRDAVLKPCATSPHHFFVGCWARSRLSLVFRRCVVCRLAMYHVGCGVVAFLAMYRLSSFSYI